MAHARSNVAFIHWGAWGDLYVSTAALREVVDEFPGDPVYVVGSGKWTQIIDPSSWPTIRGILATDDGRSGELYEAEGGRWKKREGAISVRRFFQSVKASFNIRTESLRFAWAPFLACVPRRQGSAPFPWSALLYTHRAPWLGKDPVIHERDRMLQVIEAPDRIGLLAKKWSAGAGLPKMKVPNEANAEKLAGAAFGKYWLINPTASRREKAWPAEKFRELFSRLRPVLEQNGIALKILGAPSEGEWLKEVVPAGLAAQDLIVQPPLIGDLLDVLGGAQVLVTNTSSVQFLSPGFGLTTVTLMGLANPAVWGPLGKNDVLIRGTPDPAHAHDIFLQEKEAYRSIEVDRVFAECLKLIKE